MHNQQLLPAKKKTKSIDNESYYFDNEVDN